MDTSAHRFALARLYAAIDEAVRTVDAARDTADRARQSLADAQLVIERLRAVGPLWHALSRPPRAPGGDPDQ